MPKSNSKRITTPEYLIILSIAPIPLYLLLGWLQPTILNEIQVAILYFLLGVLALGIFVTGVVCLFMKTPQVKITVIATVIAAVAVALSYKMVMFFIN